MNDNQESTEEMEQGGALSSLPDTVCSTFFFGDEVVYDLGESHGTPPGCGIVIGEPHYSDNDVLMLAGEKSIGMPIAAGHCRRTGLRDTKDAKMYRDRWNQEMDPNFLK